MARNSALHRRKEKSERLLEMKQTERKQDKTPAEPTEGGGRWVCQIWTEEQNKEGANHSVLQRKTYFSTSQSVGETSVDGWKGCRGHMVGWLAINQKRKQQR